MATKTATKTPDVEFVEELPTRNGRPSRVAEELAGIAAQLQARPGTWARVAEATRSPERWFRLKTMGCEVKLHAVGTVRSSRGNSRKVHDVFARYVAG